MKQKITNIMLAKEAGRTREYISMVLTGKTTPLKKTALSLAEATARLGVKTRAEDWLFNIGKIRKLLRGK